jgi:transcriptional regulator with XRE-family HTH domain
MITTPGISQVIMRIGAAWLPELRWLYPDRYTAAMKVARALRAARRRAGLTQSELAGLAGTSQATVCAYERGRKQPSVTTLSRLLDAAGSRLTVRGPAPAHPTAAELARTATELRDVLELAAALPSEPEPALRYPRLPDPRG